MEEEHNFYERKKKYTFKLKLHIILKYTHTYLSISLNFRIINIVKPVCRKAKGNIQKKNNMRTIAMDQTKINIFFSFQNRFYKSFETEHSADRWGHAQKIL